MLTVCNLEFIHRILMRATEQWGWPGLWQNTKEASEPLPPALGCYASPVAQRLKPEMRETWVQSLGREDPLEKEMATHSSILAWRIPWTQEPGGLQSTGSQSRTRLSDFTYLLGVLYRLSSTLLTFLFFLPSTSISRFLKNFLDLGLI